MCRAKQKTLAIVTASPSQELRLLRRFYAFHHDLDAEAPSQPEDGPNYRFVLRRVLDAPDERLVDLEKVDRKLFQMAEGRKSRPEITPRRKQERLAESGRSASESKFREAHARYACRPATSGLSAPPVMLKPIAYLINRDQRPSGVKAGGDELEHWASRAIRDLDPQSLSADQLRAIEHDLGCEFHRLDAGPVNIDQIDSLQVSRVKYVTRVEKVPHHPPPRAACACVLR